MSAPDHVTQDARQAVASLAFEAHVFALAVVVFGLALGLLFVVVLHIAVTLTARALIR